MTETLLNPRWITLEGAFNVRETGGYPALGGVTRQNALLRADSLHRLTDTDRIMLLERGLRTVIDLRHTVEVDSAPNSFTGSTDVLYRHVPIFENQPDTSSGTADLATIYRFIVDNCQSGLRQALQAITNAPEGTVLIHCTAGKDRTGIVTALALAAVGVSREDIIEDYSMTTVGMARLRPHLLGNHAIPPEAAAQMEKLLSSAPELLIALLDYIESQYGDLDWYFNQIGFSSNDRERLYARLVQSYEETPND